ncbi:unnamed protein product, partial [Allacma fusca]
SSDDVTDLLRTLAKKLRRKEANGAIVVRETRHTVAAPINLKVRKDKDLPPLTPEMDHDLGDIPIQIDAARQFPSNQAYPDPLVHCLHVRVHVHSPFMLRMTSNYMKFWDPP